MTRDKTHHATRLSRPGIQRHLLVLFIHCIPVTRLYPECLYTGKE